MKKIVLIICCLSMGFLKSLAQEKRDTATLNVQVDMPHFLYEGDRLEVTAKIKNNSANELTGQATLQLLDATTNVSVDGWFQNVFPVQYFTVAAGTAETPSFPIEVPYLFKKGLRWKVRIQSGSITDSVSEVIPILTNKLLLTEAISLPLQNGVTNYKFEKLLQSDPAIEHHSLTVELFQNPMWHIVEGLPQLFTTDYENALAVWNKFYAYMLMQKINASSPQIKQVIDNWRSNDTKDLDRVKVTGTSNGFSQEELHWINNATGELRTLIASLYDSATQLSAQKSALQKLKGLQKNNGSFSWYSNGPDDLIITQFILTGIGHLKKLNAQMPELEEDLSAILKPGLAYLDGKLTDDYAVIVKQKSDFRKSYLTLERIQYLYVRSFFPEIELQPKHLAAYHFYQQQSKQFWKSEPKLLQAFIALAQHRSGDKKTPAAILQAIRKQVSGITTEGRTVLYWWRNPVAENAALAEALSEIKDDMPMVQVLQSAIVSEESLFDWGAASVKSAACYALLLRPDFTVTKKIVRISLGNADISTNENKQEWEAGYFKEVLEAPNVNSSMGNLKTDVAQPEAIKRSEAPLTVYWRYFQSADPAIPTAPDIYIKKQLFKERSGNKESIDENGLLHVGDTVMVRLTITAKQNLAHLQIKDSYAANLEPLKRTEDHVTNGPGFFIKQAMSGTAIFLSKLKKGVSVIEYSLLVTRAGAFYTGSITVQSPYTSGITVHSESLQIQAEN